MLTSTFFSGRLLRPCPSPSKSLPHLPSWRTYPTTLDSPFHAIDSLSLSLSRILFSLQFSFQTQRTIRIHPAPFFHFFTANFYRKCKANTNTTDLFLKKRKLTQWPNWWLGFCTDHFLFAKRVEIKSTSLRRSALSEESVWMCENICACVCARFPKCCRFFDCLHQRVDHHQHQRLL